MSYITNIWVLPGGTGIGLRRSDGTEVEYTAEAVALRLAGAENVTFTPYDPENPTDTEQAILDILAALKSAGLMDADE